MSQQLGFNLLPTAGRWSWTSRSTCSWTSRGTSSERRRWERRADALSAPWATVLRGVRRLAVRALQEGEEESSSRRQEDEKESMGLAPVKPKTAYGEMLAYYLKMEPQLLKGAIEDQLQRLKEEREAKKAAEESAADVQENKNKSDLILYKRMEELRQSEQRATLEDLMYISVIEKFMELGVEMLPRMDGVVDVVDTNLAVLTEGVHSKEAIELVKEHVLSVMGPAAMAVSQAQLKLSKLQMAQVYAASIMFGYFLRRVDKRFQLERSLGLAPGDSSSSSSSGGGDKSEESQQAAEQLERLFREAGNMESVDDPDIVSSVSKSSTDDSAKASPSFSSDDQPSQGAESGKKSALRQYVESFDQETMVEMAKMISVEGAALVERQITGLFGDLKLLQQELQETVGPDVMSVEDLLKRVQEAVVNDKISTLTMTVGTQRRSILEAVSFGTFLRDVETWLETEYSLLTALPTPRLDGGPPGPAGPAF